MGVLLGRGGGGAGPPLPTPMQLIARVREIGVGSGSNETSFILFLHLTLFSIVLLYHSMHSAHWVLSSLVMLGLCLGDTPFAIHAGSMYALP